MTSNSILVVGATGKTGRRVAARLQALNVPVRLGSRSATPHFDWNDRATWADALSDIRAAYIAYYPDLASPGAADNIQAFTDLAVKSGVKRLVLLSGRGETEAERCEQIVRNSGVEWTLLRASWFCQNFSENYLLESILAGELALPVGNVSEPFVDADDIADVAVAALTDDRHVGQLYELTGPRLLTFGQAVAEISKITQRHIGYVEVSMKEYSAELERAQLPAEFISLIIYLFTEVLDGRNSSVANGVSRALGRPARDFTEYARDATASGVWQQELSDA